MQVAYLDGKDGTPTWLSDELHLLWHRLLAETDYEPRLDALPVGAVRMPSARREKPVFACDPELN